MPVPKKRVSRTRRDKRRTHHKVTLPNVVACPHCEEMMLPHRICPSCGFYKERSVVEIES